MPAAVGISFGCGRHHRTTAVKKQSEATPNVLVGPVELLHTTIPVENGIPDSGIKSEKLLEAGTVNVAIGTAVSAGSVAEL